MAKQKAKRGAVPMGGEVSGLPAVRAKAELAPVVENAGQDFSGIETFAAPGETVEMEEGGLCPVVEWEKPGQFQTGRVLEIKKIVGVVGEGKESTIVIIDSPTDGPIGFWLGTVLFGIFAKLTAKHGDLRGKRIGVQYLGDAGKSRPGQNPAKLFRVGVYREGAAS